MHGILRQVEVEPLGGEQRHVLRDQGPARLRQDSHEVGGLERLELDPDREASLELRDEVRRLRQVEGSRRDEQDVVRADHPVLRVDGGALDDRQDVALDSLAADVRAVRPLPAGDLVDLVDEDDARLLNARSTAARLTLSMSTSFCSSSCRRCSAASGTFIRRFRLRPWNRPGSMSFMLMSISSIDEPAMISKGRERLLPHRDLDHAPVEGAAAKLLPETLAGARPGLPGGPGRLRVRRGPRADRRRGRQQQVQEALLRVGLRLLADLHAPLLPDHVDRELDQVAHHRLDVAAGRSRPR